MMLPGSMPLQFAYVGRIGANEFLLRLSPEEPDELSGHTFVPYRLTGPELEVLSWVVDVKSNRDTADILGLSTRTIDKHLAQIYTKIEVECQTTATTLVRRPKNAYILV